MPFGLDEPVSITAIAFCGAFHLAAREEVWVSARQCDRIKGPKRGLNPPLMPMRVTRLRTIGEGCEDLDQHMIAAKAEGRRRRRHARGGAPELVGDDGAAR